MELAGLRVEICRGGDWGVNRSCEGMVSTLRTTLEITELKARMAEASLRSYGWNGFERRSEKCSVVGGGSGEGRVRWASNSNNTLHTMD